MTESTYWWSCDLYACYWYLTISAKFCGMYGRERHLHWGGGGSKNNKKRSTRSKIKDQIGTECLKMVKRQVLLKNVTNFR